MLKVGIVRTVWCIVWILRKRLCVIILNVRRLCSVDLTKTSVWSEIANPLESLRAHFSRVESSSTTIEFLRSSSQSLSCKWITIAVVGVVDLVLSVNVEIGSWTIVTTSCRLGS